MTRMSDGYDEDPYLYVFRIRFKSPVRPVSSLRRCFWHSCLLCSVLATPAVPALRVCPPLIISFSCLSRALSNTWCVFLLPSRAYAIRVCPTLGCSLSWFPHLGQINATRCEAVSSLPLFCYKPCTPHVLLCSPHGACQSCLSDAWCVFLLPSRSYAIRVCPTLSCSLSWIRHLGRINATKCEAVCRQVLLALMSALLSTCSPHRTCHACLPATYYVLLLPFPRASAICVCAKSDARCPSTSLVLLFPSLPRAPYTTFPHALTLSPLLNVGRGPAPWPDKQLCVAVSSLCRCFKHSCLRHTWRPPQTSSFI